MIDVPGIDRITETSARITVSCGYEDGKQKRKKITVDIPKKIQGDQEKIRDWLIAERARFAEKIRRGEIGNRTLTLEKWAEIWLNEYIMPDRKTGTYDSHEGNWRLHIKPELGKVKLENLTPTKIKQFANRLQQKENGRGGKLSTVTIGNVRRTLSAMLETAVKQELMPSNPAKKVDWPSEERRQGKALTSEEYAKLYKEIEAEPIIWRALFMLIISTGMRRGEAVGLDWAQVDLESNKIYITQSAVTTASKGVEIATPKTKAGIRTNFIPGEVITMLRKLKAEQMQLCLLTGQPWVDSKPVFTNESAGKRIHPDSVTARFAKICKKAGLEMRLHDLRHSYVSAAIHQKAPVTDIARQVGHASTDVTLRVYAHAFGDEIDTSKQLSELVQSAYKTAK